MNRNRDLFAVLFLCLSFGAGISLVSQNPEVVVWANSPFTLLLGALVHGTQVVVIGGIVAGMVIAALGGLYKLATAPRELQLCAFIVAGFLAYHWWVNWLLGPAYVESDLLVGHDPLSERDIALVRLGALGLLLSIILGFSVAYRGELSALVHQRWNPPKNSQN